MEATLHGRLIPMLLACLLLWTSALPALAQQPYSSSDLDTLVGPIALYPDPLLTNVVRASTFPDQVIAASKTNSKDNSWDDSVKALDDYPTAVTLMASNVNWMKSLGWASTHQLPDLMDAVQRYRYRAQQAGNLTTNDKVTVIVEGSTIRLEPTNAQVIYVPTYQPADVDDHDFLSGFLWGTGVATSAYLWTNVYHWNDGLFYTHPYGWYPPVGYYRPYGWQNAGVYGGNTVRLNGGNNVVRGPVTVNNVNVNRNKVGNTNVNANRVQGGNRTNVSTGNRTNVNSGNRTSTGNRTNVSAGNRPNINSGNRSTFNSGSWTGNSRQNWSNRVPAQAAPSISRPAASGNVERTRSAPNLGSYSSAGSTVRESNRGAASRGASSYSSGARMGGGRRR